MDESTHTPGKRCKTCREVKPLTEFTKQYARKVGGKNYWRGSCRDCNNAYVREYQRERREFLSNYKSERGCADCGYNKHHVALDFDHRPGEVKLFEPAWLKQLGTWQQMIDEIAKCDVVCSNCHRIRTITRPPANAKYDLNREQPVVTSWHDPYYADPAQMSLFEPPAA